MSGISSHVLDTSLGKPAVGLRVSLAVLEAGDFQIVGYSTTDQDGRVNQLLGDRALSVGLYRLRFETGAHYRATDRDSLYECVEVQFHVRNAGEHHHVPLLMGPFSYSTYRGT